MQYYKIPSRTAGTTAAILAILFLLSAAVYAGDNSLDYDIFIFDGRLTADFDFSGLFNPDLLSSIKKGFPLHIDFVSELKKSIPVWFDPTLDNYRSYINIEYKSFGARFEMNVLDFAGELHQQTFKLFENLISGLNEILILECDSIRNYKPDDNLYFNYKIEIRRLTADEIAHAGDWYRGKTSAGGDTSQKSPKNNENIFDQLLDITGMGPAKYHFSSYIFKPAELKEVRP